jgi:rhodanese-related sulfurtransferase
MFAKFADKTKVEKLLEKDATLVDMRSPVAFRNGSIEGSVNLPLKNFLNRLPGLDKNKGLILFSDAKNHPDVTSAINYAAQLGFSNIFVSEYNTLKDK